MEDDLVLAIGRRPVPHLLDLSTELLLWPIKWQLSFPWVIQARAKQKLQWLFILSLRSHILLFLQYPIGHTVQLYLVWGGGDCTVMIPEGRDRSQESSRLWFLQAPADSQANRFHLLSHSFCSSKTSQLPSGVQSVINSLPNLFSETWLHFLALSQWIDPTRLSTDRPGLQGAGEGLLLVHARLAGWEGGRGSAERAGTEKTNRKPSP